MPYVLANITFIIVLIYACKPPATKEIQHLPPKQSERTSDFNNGTFAMLSEDDPYDPVHFLYGRTKTPKKKTNPLANCSSAIDANHSVAEQITECQFTAHQALEAPNKLLLTEAIALPISTLYCQQMDAVRQKMPRFASKDYPSWYRHYLAMATRCFIDVHSERESGLLSKIVLINRGSPYTNPDGYQYRGLNPLRSFSFSFRSRARQNMKLSITDNAAMNSRISHNFFESTLIFIPRKIIPYVNIDDANGRLTVYLPTGEPAVFDLASNELIQGLGVLHEAAIDRLPSRYKRQFAQVSYSGTGILVRADRRAGLPEIEYRKSLNIHEAPKHAIVSYRGKNCRVRKNRLWQQDDAHPHFRYDDDARFIKEIANDLCGWDIPF